MSDIQLNRSPDLYDRDSKPKRNLAKYQIPAPSKASPGPGPNLIETVANFWMSQSQPRTEEQNAEYEAALEIVNSYLLRPRFRTLRYPMGPHNRPNDWLEFDCTTPDEPAKIFISDENETLENPSLCFGAADVAAMKAADTSTSFAYTNQPGVLSGPSLQEYLTTAKSLVSYSQMKDDETEERKLERKATRKTAPKKTKATAPTTAPILRVSSSSDALNAEYTLWFDRPTTTSKWSFFDVFKAFIARKARFIQSSDTLSKRGVSEDVGSDFVIEMMPKLIAQQNAGTRLTQPAQYLTRCWTNFCHDQREDLEAEDEVTIQLHVPARDDDDTDGEGVDLSDKESSLAWFRSSNAAGEVQDETETEYLQRCKAMLGTIEDESLRDVAGLWMAMKTERQIADELGISPQKVGRLKVKINTALANVKGTAVLK